jgi:hypothetical protein
MPAHHEFFKRSVLFLKKKNNAPFYSLKNGVLQDVSFSLKKEVGDKKEYPIDVSLPDINNGVYGSNDFRMYSFKVKPCSRAYSHD